MFFMPGARILLLFGFFASGFARPCAWRRHCEAIPALDRLVVYDVGWRSNWFLYLLFMMSGGDRIVFYGFQR